MVELEGWGSFCRLGMGAVCVACDVMFDVVVAGVSPPLLVAVVLCGFRRTKRQNLLQRTSTLFVLLAI